MLFASELYLTSTDSVDSMVSAVSNITESSVANSTTPESSINMTKPPPISTSNKIKHHPPKDDKPLPITPNRDEHKTEDKGTSTSSKEEPSSVTNTNSQKTESADKEAKNGSESPSEDDTEYRLIAKRLFDEEFVSIKPQEYTQFLAAGDRDSTKIRNYYMNLFTWPPNLLKSTRMLCSKLYLKGESQEIDRILSSFTKSYLKQHPKNVFCTKNFEQIYIIIYSLILLNTALHNLELNKKSRISQSDFIRNTFTTFVQQNEKLLKSLSVKQKIAIENELSNFYEDLSKNELHLKTADEAGSSSISQSQHHHSHHNHHHHHHHHHNDHGHHNNTLGNRLSKVSQDSAATETTNASTNSPITPANESNNEDGAVLTRQQSASSIWSTDTTNRRSSLAMKRYTTTTSEISNFNATAQNPNRLPVQRVGMARALVGHQRQQQFQSEKSSMYKNGNPSLYSQASAVPQLKNRPSYDQMKSLNKRSSRQSVISKDSSHNDDDMISVLSFDTMNLPMHDESDSQRFNQQMEDFNVDDYQDKYDLTLELQGSPYLKEGLLKLKILNNDSVDEIDGNSNPSASSTPANHGKFLSFFSRPANSSSSTSNMNNHKFTENFVVISKGELSLYSFDPKVIKKFKKRNGHQQQQTEPDDDDIVGDGNWLKNAAKIGTYNLCSTYADLEKTTSQGKVLWSLTFPKTSKRQPKKFIFEAGTKEVALEFINTCNFWAAKITAIPTLEESVSSLEYGWTNLDYIIAHRESFKKSRNIMKYEPVVKGVYLSNYIVNSEETNHLGMMRQFVKTSNYYNQLKKLYNEFTEMRQKFLINLPKCHFNCSNHSKILSNYDTKINDYNLEMKKYKNYLIILGFGLQLRFDLEEQDRQQQYDTSLENEDVDDDEEGEEDYETIGETLATTDRASSAGAKSNDTSYQDDELTKLVKFEIKKLFFNMKDISKVIPTFRSLKSIKNLADLAQDIDNKLVKSPKTFTLANYNDNESPINQLLATTNAIPTVKSSSMIMELSIAEEPEDAEDSETTRRSSKVNNSKDHSPATSISSSIKKPNLKIANSEVSALVI